MPHRGADFPHVRPSGRPFFNERSSNADTSRSDVSRSVASRAEHINKARLNPESALTYWAEQRRADFTNVRIRFFNALNS